MYKLTKGGYACEDADEEGDGCCKYDCCPSCFKGDVVKQRKVCSEELPLMKSTQKRDRYLSY